MKNMKTTQTLTESIIEKLRKAADELEEFRLQIALGKADASDKFEEVKKGLTHFLADLRLKLEKARTVGGEKAVAFRAALEDLQLQLSLGRADLRVHYEIQQKKIIAAMNKIERMIAAASEEIHLSPEIKDEINQELVKARIKLHILRLKFELKKMNVKEKVSDHFKAPVDMLSKLADKIKAAATEKEEKSKLKHFNEELQEAYKHLKTAFGKL